MTTLFKALLVSSLLCFGTAVSWAESIDTIDPVVEAEKPLERPDGTLDFTGLTNPDIARFQAEQSFLLNRRLSLINESLIIQMTAEGHVPEETVSKQSELAMQLDRVMLKTIRTHLPNVPDDLGNFGRYLYSKPYPKQ